MPVDVLFALAQLREVLERAEGLTVRTEWAGDRCTVTFGFTLKEEDG